MPHGLDSLLDEVGRLHGVVFGRDGDAFTLAYVDTAELRLTPVNSGRHVELCAELTSILPDHAVDIMARALRANMDPADTGPGWLVLDKNRPVLLLRERHDLESLDAQRLAEVMSAMIARARRLRDQLAQGEPPLAAPAAETPLAWTRDAHVIIRG